MGSESRGITKGTASFDYTGFFNYRVFIYHDTTVASVGAISDLRVCASRVLHFYALVTAKTHDLRATFWTIGSVIVIIMSMRVLLFALN